MKTEIKEKILSLLDSKEQTTRVLVAPIRSETGHVVKNEYCFCIQGIFALALGAEVSLRDTDHLTLQLKEEGYRRVLPWQILTEVDIPLELKPRFILDNLQLNEVSTTKLKLLDEAGCTIQWIELNDCYNFTFSQFRTLVSLL